MIEEESELGAVARRTLDSARHELSPTALDEARIRALTARAVQAGSALGFEGRTRAVHTFSTGSLLLTAAGIAVLSGALGYVLGQHASTRQANDAASSGAPPAGQATQSIPPVVVAPAPPAQAATPTAQSPLGAAAVGGDAYGAPGEVATVSTPRKPRLNASPKSEQQQQQPSTPGSSAAPVAAPDRGASLAAEVRALRAIQTALHEQRPKRALSLLDELDRDVPNGELREERAAAFAIARCAIGLGSAASVLSEFSQAYPESFYLPRVKDSCRQR